MSVDTFGIEKEFLRDLLKEVVTGRAQLPEFQRGWVWPDKNIASLLASISLGYPAGTLMMLRTGGDVRFKLRPVEGAMPLRRHSAGTADPGRPAASDLLVPVTRLGQAGARRRTCASTRSLAGSTWTCGWLWIPTLDREDAILFLPADRMQRNFRGEVTADYSTAEKEYEACLFPLAKVFDPDDWSTGFQEKWDYDREKIKLWNSFNREVVQQFDRYQLPVIELNRDTHAKQFAKCSRR